MEISWWSLGLGVFRVSHQFFDWFFVGLDMVNIISNKVIYGQSLVGSDQL
jgi:hypothetical protein